MPKNMKEEISWLAGIFEGEGSLTFGYWDDKGYPHKRRYLSITNTDLVLLDKVATLIERIIGKKPARYISDKRQIKPCYRIVVQTPNEVIKVCKAIEPYVIGYKSQTIKLYYEFEEKGES